MKHLFKYTIHDKTISVDDIFEAIRRCGIVINGVIHWGISCQDIDYFSICSNYTKDHFEGIEQVITKRDLELYSIDPETRHDPILTFKYLKSQ